MRFMYFGMKNSCTMSFIVILRMFHMQIPEMIIFLVDLVQTTASNNHLQVVRVMKIFPLISHLYQNTNNCCEYWILTHLLVKVPETIIFFSGFGQTTSSTICRLLGWFFFCLYPIFINTLITCQYWELTHLLVCLCFEWYRSC